MYLWRKDAGFFFQMRIPARQAVNLGATPLRIWLGALKKRDAQRRATVLAVAAVGRTEAAGILHEIGVVAGSHALYRGLDGGLLADDRRRSNPSGHDEHVPCCTRLRRPGAS